MTKERYNKMDRVTDDCARNLLLLINGGLSLCRGILKHTRIDIDECLANDETYKTLKELKSSWRADGKQLDLFFPPTDLQKWDVTLMSRFLKYCSELQPPERDIINKLSELMEKGVNLWKAFPELTITDEELGCLQESILTLLNEGKAKFSVIYSAEVEPICHARQFEVAAHHIEKISRWCNTEIEYQGCPRYSVVHEAAYFGKLRTLEYIVNQSPDRLRETDEDGNEAIHLAASGGHIDCLQYLIDNGVDPYQKTEKHKENILYKAIKGGQLEIVRYICDKYPALVLEQDSYMSYPIHTSASMDKEIGRCLIRYGADVKVRTPDTQNKQDRHALHIATNGGSEDFIKILFEEVTDQNVIDEMIVARADGGYSVGHAAALSGDLRCLKLLVGHGLDLTATSDKGKTMLHMAAQCGFLPIVEYLCNTNPRLKNTMHLNGSNALHTAAYGGSLACLKYLLEQQDMIPYTPTSKNGHTILHQAVLAGHLPITVYICEKYPQLKDMTDTKGFGVLHSAAYGGSLDCLKYLLEHGMQADTRSTDSRTILHRAAYAGHLPIAVYICENYPQLKCMKDKNGFGALHSAAYGGSLDCLKYLLEHGMQADKRSKNGHNILHQAVLAGHLPITVYICEKYPQLKCIKDKNGFDALHSAANGGSLACLKYLLEQQDMIPDTRSSKNCRTILHQAAYAGHLPITVYICENYPQLKCMKDKNGFGALHSAANGGSLDCLKYLLEHGMQADKRSKNGHTILHQAVLAGHLPITVYICEKYPQLKCIKDKNGFDALHSAANGGSLACLKYLLEQQDMISDTRSSKNCRTILHQAALTGHLPITVYICENYPQLKCMKDKNGFGALHSAAYGGSLDCLKYLLEHGMQADTRSTDGRTILHQAVLAGHLPITVYICEKYPQLKCIKDKNGFDALHSAANGGSLACLKYLLEHGMQADKRSKNGLTILHQAVLACHLPIIVYICEKYPQLKCIKDKNGFDALHSAANGGSLACLKYLLEQQDMIPDTRSSKNYRTILHQAAYAGHLPITVYICEKYPQLKCMKDKNGFGALHSAAYGGSLDCLKYLLEQQDMIPDTRSSKNCRTILHQAALTGHLPITVYICENYPQLKCMKDKNGFGALHSAAYGGSLDCLKYLLEHGMQADKRSKNGLTILHQAVLAGHLPITVYICEKYPQLKCIKDKNGFDALHSAANGGSLACLKYLLEQQDMISDTRSKNGLTILHQAVLACHLPIIVYICEKYPQLKCIKDKNGFDALHSAANGGSLACLKYLLEQQVMIPDTRSSKNYRTILHQAAYAGHLPITVYICEKYPQLKCMKDKNGFGALHSAAYGGSLDCLKYLLEQQDMIPDTRSSKNCRTILHQAALTGHLPITVYICENYPQLKCMKDKNGFGALHSAAYGGSLDCLKYLLEHGMQADKRSKNGLTILHQAVLAGHLPITVYICEKYPQLKCIKDKNGFDALHSAANGVSLACLKYLLEQQDMISDTRSKNGLTILHQAVLACHLPIIVYICEKYPQLKCIKDKNGFDALHSAANGGSLACLKYLLEQQVMIPDTRSSKNYRTILHQAAYAGHLPITVYICEKYPQLKCMKDKNGFGALHSAAYGGSLDCLKYLLEHGMQADKRSKNGHTILHQAVLAGHLPITVYICENYPQLKDMTDTKGFDQTALFSAVCGDHLDVLATLIDQGMSPDHRNKYGQTILHIAARAGKTDIVRYIHTNHVGLVPVRDRRGDTAAKLALQKGNDDCVQILQQ